ncbi:MAG: helix-turn-helix domain-containing protein [Rickettsiales bacterium]
MNKPFSIEAESRHTLERSVEDHLQQYFAAHTGGHLPPPGLYGRILPLIEKPLIEMTLKATEGNQVKAAFILGINRNTLRKKIQMLDIDMESLL